MLYHSVVEGGAGMDPIQAMTQHKAEFTKNDQQIYEAIMANPDQVTYQSTTKLAEACGVSQSAPTASSTSSDLSGFWPLPSVC